MLLKPKTSAEDAPELKKIDVSHSIRFKAKEGEYEIYSPNNEEKKSKVKTINFIFGSDSRFTVQGAAPVKGVSIFAGSYNSPKQTITVFKKSGDSKTTVADKGTWEELKDIGKYKYTKLVHGLLETKQGYEPAVIELKGLGISQFDKIKDGGTDGVVTLGVSVEPDYETPHGKFYSMVNLGSKELTTEQETVANDFAQELEESYQSEDERYKFFKNTSNQIDLEEGAATSSDEIEQANAEYQSEVNPEDIPF